VKPLSFVIRDDGADVLVVTNMWPDEDRPVCGIFIKRQVESLRAAGVRCDVLYLRGYRSKLVYLYAALRFLFASITWRGRYRLVHVHSGGTSLASRFFLMSPMIVTYHGDDVLGNRRSDGTISVYDRLRSSAIRAASVLFTATVTQSKTMQQRLPRATRRNDTVLPCGVDPELFRPVERAEARQRLGWSQSERVALFAATFPDTPRKRLWLAEAAVAHASSCVGPIRLHVSGTTPPDEMPVLMSAADCLIHTASVEGAPLVVREALMCNLPIVATPSGDLTELLTGVDCSDLCPPDPEALGSALSECLGRERRSNGRERRAGEISKSVEISRLLALYEGLASPRR
jgi:glycosyltransferase involved in cell wall biosynthesis